MIVPDSLRGAGNEVGDALRTLKGVINEKILTSKRRTGPITITLNRIDMLLPDSTFDFIFENQVGVGEVISNECLKGWKDCTITFKGTRPGRSIKITLVPRS